MPRASTTNHAQLEEGNCCFGCEESETRDAFFCIGDGLGVVGDKVVSIFRAVGCCFCARTVAHCATYLGGVVSSIVATLLSVTFTKCWWVCANFCECFESCLLSVSHCVGTSVGAVGDRLVDTVRQLGCCWWTSVPPLIWGCVVDAVSRIGTGCQMSVVACFGCCSSFCDCFGEWLMGASLSVGGRVGRAGDRLIAVFGRMKACVVGAFWRVCNWCMAAYLARYGGWEQFEDEDDDNELQLHL